MSRSFFPIFFSLLGVAFLGAQSPIQYHLGLEDIGQHKLHISVEFSALPDQVFEVRMPRSSPGRYALHEFAKNVYEVAAFDQSGKALAIHQVSPHQWNISGHDGFVRFEYTLFGNHADGTYSGFDNRKVHMNMPATFVYGVDLAQRPIELSIDLSDHPDWKVATQLQHLENGSFGAPDYDYFYDSPTIAGALDFRRWESGSNGKSYTIEIAMLHEGTAEELDAYSKWTQQVVEAQKAVFGELPDFDFGRYTFLCSYNPWGYGDGMEHRNSTVCSSPGSLARNASGLIGTVSHEFFHCWNVERIRPKSLEPFDFDKANMSEALWFAEGFTSYYTNLILCRAGIITPEEYIRGLTGRTNTVLTAPGRKYRSPVEMSYNAPFVDAATSVDANNFQNNYISYYSYGAVVGLSLDLLLRSEYNSSLDAFMRQLWQEYGKPEIPYQLTDLERVLGEVSQDPAFAKQFFEQCIYGSELPDMEELLQKFGVSIQLAFPDRFSFAERITITKKGGRVNDNVLENSPLYPAGINQGDIILEIDGTPLNSEDALKEFQRKLKNGRQYQIKYLQNGLEQTGSFIATPDTRLVIEPDEEASARAMARQKAWLSND